MKFKILAKNIECKQTRYHITVPHGIQFRVVEMSEFASESTDLSQNYSLCAKQ